MNDMQVIQLVGYHCMKTVIQPTVEVLAKQNFNYIIVCLVKPVRILGSFGFDSFNVSMGRVTAVVSPFEEWLARSKNGLCDHYLSRCFCAITFERNGLGT
jgi:hypothetical protein